MMPRSSATSARSATRNPRRSSASTTAGPERSTFSPREQESLTVTTAAVIPLASDILVASAIASAVEQDIFALSIAFSATLCATLSRIALRFVEQTQSLHQQALRIQRRRLFIRVLRKINLKVPVRPAQHLKDRLIPHRRTVRRMLRLTLREVNLALVVGVSHRQQTAFTPHFERLHQLDHIHLRQAAAQHAVRRLLFLRQFLQRNPVHNALDSAH